MQMAKELPDGFVHTEVSPFDEDFEDWDEEDFDAEPRIVDDPRRIYEFLRSKVYKQDEACKQAAIILYNHTHGRPSRNLFCGPSGSGKTYVWQIIREELYPYVIIANAADMSKSGFIGKNKVSSPLYEIEEPEEDYIIVYDEIDKLVAPLFVSGGENVSSSIQAELLALIYPSSPRIRLHVHAGEEIKLTIKNYSWIFCGSFAMAAENIADGKRKHSSGIGFGATKTEANAFDEELTMTDIIDFGMIPEFASRITRLVNLRPMGVEDYHFLINEFENSPIKVLEAIYNFPDGYIMQNIISNEKLDEIATNTYESGLGVRNAYSQIQQMIDNYIFDNFNELTF